jgi:hypothetical protein
MPTPVTRTEHEARAAAAAAKARAVLTPRSTSSDQAHYGELRQKWACSRYTSRRAHHFDLGPLLLRAEDPGLCQSCLTRFHALCTQHRRDEAHPLGVVRHAPRRHMLVGVDADMIDPDDLGHLRYTVDVFVEVREKVPDSDRAAGLGGIGPDRPRSRKVAPTRPKAAGAGRASQTERKREKPRTR